jgi:hypothetical protein
MPASWCSVVEAGDGFDHQVLHQVSCSAMNNSLMSITPRTFVHDMEAMDLAASQNSPRACLTVMSSGHQAESPVLNVFTAPAFALQLMCHPELRWVLRRMRSGAGRNHMLFRIRGSDMRQVFESGTYDSN